MDKPATKTDRSKVLFSRLFLACTLWVAASAFALGATYYVDPSRGNDSNAGTQQAPWRTLAKANTVLRAGDTVFLRGGEYNADIIRPANSGRAGQYITYQAFPGEKPVLTNANAAGRTAIVLDGRSYIMLDGIAIDGKGIYMNSNTNHWASFDNTHHCIIQNCDFKHARGWHGIQVDGGSTYNKFFNSNFSVCGTWDKHGPGNDTNNNPLDNDFGDLFHIKCGRFNLIEQNTFSKGGHDILVIDDSYNVVRENVFVGDWENGFGSRCVTLSARPRHSCSSYNSSGTSSGGYNVFENNILKNVKWENETNVAMKVHGFNQIVRDNIFHKNIGFGILIESRNPVPHSSKNKIYNNAFVEQTYGAILVRDFSGQGRSIQENIFKNNILYNNRLRPVLHSGREYVIGNHDLVLHLQFLGGPFNNNFFNDNIVFNTEQRPSVFVRNAGNSQSLDQVHSNKEASKYFYRNHSANPMFYSENAGNSLFLNLRPDSPAIDAGDFLTHARGNGSGTVITVLDAGYFFDGFGIVEGDMLQVGSNNPVRITKVDYARNTITLASSIAWRDNDPVSLPYSGSAPDIGPFEFNSGKARGEVRAISLTGNLQFGEVTIGENATRSLTIANTGTSPLTVNNLALPVGFTASWTSGTISAGELRAVTITFTPTEEKSYTGNIAVTSNATTGTGSIAVTGTGKKKVNRDPAIRITSPRGGEQYTRGGNLPITVEASDPDGQVVRVEYLVGAQRIGESRTAPFSFTWQNLPLGAHVLTARATDNDGGVTTSAQVGIVVNEPAPPPNQAPVANTGGSRSITLPTHSTTLNGSGTDADGTIARFAWAQRSGPSTATLSGAATATLTVSNLVAGSYVFRLTVTDNQGATGFADATVTVHAAPVPNQAPVANAGGNRSITLPTNSVTLNGSATDADGTIARLAWAQRSGPSTATLSGAATAALTASNLVAGTYVFRFTATDNQGATGFADATVTVNPAPTPANVVSSLTLINAQRDQDVAPLRNGDVISLVAFPELNIRANVAGTVGSVLFYLDGRLFRRENEAPYAFAGDLNGDYFSWTPAPGEYEVTAKAFTGRNGGGQEIGSLTVRFRLVREAIQGFALANAATNRVVGSLNNGDEINLRTTGSLNIQAEVTNMPIGSVVFTLNGQVFRRENTSPYTLAGYSNNRFNSWVPRPGEYELRAEAFSGSNGSGASLGSRTVRFTVIDRVLGDFVLIDAARDRDLRIMTDGMGINLQENNELNVRAEVLADGVASVVFLLNGQVFRRENEAPYALAGDLNGDYFSWTPRTGGYTLTVQAYSDRNGRGTLLDTRTLTFRVVDQAPRKFAITSPNEGEEMATGQEMTIAVNDPGDLFANAKVEFFANDIKIGEVPAGSRQLVWSTLTEGKHALVARVRAGQQQAATDPVEISVVKARPAMLMVNILSPLPNTVFEYARPVQLEASATDKDGNRVVNVAFYHGDKLLAEARGSSLNFQWRSPDPGEYEIVAKATARNGEVVSSTPVKFSVLTPAGMRVSELAEVAAPAPLAITFGPNPVVTDFTLQVDHPSQGTVDVGIYDITGAFLQQVTFEKQLASPAAFQGNLDHLPVGVYTFKVMLGEHTKTVKVLKK